MLVGELNPQRRRLKEDRGWVGHFYGRDEIRFRLTVLSDNLPSRALDGRCLLRLP